MKDKLWNDQAKVQEISNIFNEPSLSILTIAAAKMHSSTSWKMFLKMTMSPG
jgi:hypothetical protein